MEAVSCASERIAIRYYDPKDSDGTDREAATYDQRCRQIDLGLGNHSRPTAGLPSETEDMYPAGF